MEKSIFIHDRNGNKLLLELVVIDEYPIQYAVKRTGINGNCLSIISKKKFNFILKTAREKGCIIYDYTN